MKLINKKVGGLILWIVSLQAVGSVIGFLTSTNLNSWYKVLDRSPLTPPDYWFGIVWTILYCMIAISGWLIWSSDNSTNLKTAKKLYILQLILNWAWSPLFFVLQAKGWSLLCLAGIILLVAALIFNLYRNLRLAAWLLVPYLAWLLLACHLNFYIWMHN